MQSSLASLVVHFQALPFSGSSHFPCQTSNLGSFSGFVNSKYIAMSKLQPIRITRGDFSCNFVIEVFWMPSNKIVGIFENFYYATQMHAFLRCKYAWCKCNSETLNTEYFQQRSTSINSKKVTGDPYMTWTNDPKPDPKRKHTGHLDWYWCQYFHFSYLLFGHLMPHRFLRYVSASRFANCAPLWA